MIHPEDAESLELHNGEMMEITSRRGSVKAEAWITKRVLPGLVWMSFHFPDCPTNQLTNDAADNVTHTYEYKVCAVKLRRIPTEEHNTEN